MPVYNSVELALIDSGRIDMLDVGAFSGNLHFQQATVPWEGQALNDIINLFTIPRGGRVLLMYSNATFTSGASIRIGDFENSSKHRTPAILSGLTQGRIAFPSTSLLLQGIALPYQQETTIFLTVTGAVLSTTGGAVFTCVYTFD